MVAGMSVVALSAAAVVVAAVAALVMRRTRWCAPGVAALTLGGLYFARLSHQPHILPSPAPRLPATAAPTTPSPPSPPCRPPCPSAVSATTTAWQQQPALVSNRLAVGVDVVAHDLGELVARSPDECYQHCERTTAECQGAVWSRGSGLCFMKSSLCNQTISGSLDRDLLLVSHRYSGGVHPGRDRCYPGTTTVPSRLAAVGVDVVGHDVVDVVARSPDECYQHCARIAVGCQGAVWNRGSEICFLKRSLCNQTKGGPDLHLLLVAHRYSGGVHPGRDRCHLPGQGNTTALQPVSSWQAVGADVVGHDLGELPARSPDECYQHCERMTHPVACQGAVWSRGSEICFLKSSLCNQTKGGPHLYLLLVSQRYSGGVHPGRDRCHLVCDGRWAACTAQCEPAGRRKWVATRNASASALCPTSSPATAAAVPWRGSARPTPRTRSSRCGPTMPWCT